MPSSCRRSSAAASRCSKIRSPALSWATTSVTLSHSGVAYSGCEPTSRYSRAPFSRNTFEDRPQWTTRLNRYRATSSGLSRRCPRRVQVTPYSFSSPKMRRSIPSNGSVRAVQRTRMVRLATVRTTFHGRVIAARLGAEGIVTDLRGNVDGIYPMGDVHVFVASEDLPEAQELLLVDEVESAFDEDGDGDIDVGAPRELWIFLVAVVLVAAVLFARSV